MRYNTLKVKTMQKTKRKTKQQPKGVRHHAKRLYHLTPKFVHGMGIGAFAGIVLLMTFGPIIPVSALSINSPRDCDTNAVIPCGSLSTNELKKDYNNTSYKGVKALYSDFGISSADINNIGKTAQIGRVYKNGDVKIGSTVVATNAVTAGREFIAGSTKTTAGGSIFYTRKPSVSFRIESIPAFVVMEKGEFKYAILAACGNPVKATAKKKVTVVKPTKEEPEIVPVATPPGSTQAPESQPVPEVVSDAEVLPETGPGDIVMVVCLAIVGGYLYHVTHRRIKHRRHAKHSV